VVIGGVISSTLLTLLMLPALYDLVETLMNRGPRWRFLRVVSAFTSRNGQPATTRSSVAPRPESSSDS
jgi:hypothetical protein